MKIDINKKYHYRDGKTARILCVDAPGEYPVITVDEDGDVYTHTPDGWQTEAGRNAGGDLIEIREPREWWIIPSKETSFTGDAYTVQQFNGQGQPIEGQIRCLEIID